MQFIRAVYEHREKHMPFIAILFSGLKSKKILFAAVAKSRLEAEALLDEAWRDVTTNPIDKAGKALSARYKASVPKA